MTRAEKTLNALQKGVVIVVRSNYGVFPIIAPHEIIAPHYGIVTMNGGGAIVYLTTKLGGGYNGKDPNYVRPAGLF